MGTKLYVGNLPYTSDEAVIRDVFGQNGRQVTNVHVVQDHATGRSRGFAFVEMASPEDAANAIRELNGTDMEGRPLIVNEARERGSGPPRPSHGHEDRSGGYRGGGGGGGGGGGYRSGGGGSRANSGGYRSGGRWGVDRSNERSAPEPPPLPPEDGHADRRRRYDRRRRRDSHEHDD